MSSHREAPEISKDPVADSTDLYAFVSPDNPDTVTIIANYVPLEGPTAGRTSTSSATTSSTPSTSTTTVTASADIVYPVPVPDRRRPTPTPSSTTPGPIPSLTDPNWNRRQTYSRDPGRQRRTGPEPRTVLGTGLACPPCNIGPLSTPDYAGARPTPPCTTCGNGVRVFAGQRAEGFYVDLGSIFDLGILRPFEQDHTTFGLSSTGHRADGGRASTPPRRSTSTASPSRCPISAARAPTAATPTDAASPNSVIGVWTSAYRQKVQVRDDSGEHFCTRPLRPGVAPRQPARERGHHPAWARRTTGTPSRRPATASSRRTTSNPELAQLLPVLYPGVFPNLAAYNAGRRPEPRRPRGHLAHRASRPG